uniref:Muscle specific protein 20 like n=1 Tax=Ornithodoros brasiliensis TaxID=888526 RepID=A0A1D2AJU0_ORNBR
MRRLNKDEKKGSNSGRCFCLHVSRVAEVLSTLCGALVGTVLQADDALTSAELFLGPVALGLLGGLGAEAGAGVLRVHVASAADGGEALANLGDVPLLPQVNGLEDIDFGDTPLLASILEEGDVLHELELATTGVDLGNAAGHQLVHELAEDGAVAENISEVSLGQLDTQNGGHPLEELSLHLGIALAGDLVGHLGAKSIGGSTVCHCVCWVGGFLAVKS